MTEAELRHRLGLPPLDGEDNPQLVAMRDAWRQAPHPQDIGYAGRVVYHGAVARVVPLYARDVPAFVEASWIEPDRYGFTLP